MNDMVVMTLALLRLDDADDGWSIHRGIFRVNADMVSKIHDDGPVCGGVLC